MRDQTQDELASYVHTAEAQASEHPWLTIAGGFGSGVALGIASPRANGHKASSSSSKGASNGNDESLLAKGVGALFSAAGGPVFDEVRGTLQDSVNELKDTLQDTVSDVVHGLTGSSSNGNKASQPPLQRHVAA